MPGDGVDRHAREVGEVREEGAVAARTRRRAPGGPSRTRPRCARPAPGHHLVAEGGGRRRFGDAGHEGGVRAGGPGGPGARPGASPPAGRSSATTSSGHSTTRRGAGRAHAGRRGHLRREDQAGGTSCLLTPRCPPPWTSATRSVRTGAPPSGATVPATARTTIPAARGGGADDGGPATVAAAAQRAAPSVARATPPAHTPAVMRSGPPRRASSTSGTVGLAQEHAAQREPAEGPGHAHGLGEGARPTKAGARPCRAGARRPRRRRRGPRRG